MERRSNFFIKYILLISVFFTIKIYASEVRVGYTKINVPPLAGFTEVDHSSIETFKIFQKLCPSNSRLLSVLLTQEDAEKIHPGEPAAFDGYIVVQSFQEFEKTTLTKYEFEEIREAIRKEWQSRDEESRKLTNQMIGKAEEIFSDNNDFKMALALNDIISFGVNLETELSITMSQLMKVDANVEGNNIESTMAETATVLLIKGKVIHFYVCKQFNSGDDLKWVRETAKEYAAQILSANGITENKVIVNNKRNAVRITRDYIKEAIYGKNIPVMLVMVITFSWVIGLTPPILLRHVILRKPLSKKSTIFIIVFLYLINIIAFAALGSLSIITLFLVALASYYIMHRNYGGRQKCIDKG